MASSSNENQNENSPITTKKNAKSPPKDHVNLNLNFFSNNFFFHFKIDL
jgi:hypothetical protein